MCGLRRRLLQANGGVEVSEGRESRRQVLQWGPAGLPTLCCGTFPRRTDPGRGREQLGRKAGRGGAGVVRVGRALVRAQNGGRMWATEKQDVATVVYMRSVVVKH